MSKQGDYRTTGTIAVIVVITLLFIGGGYALWTVVGSSQNQSTTTPEGVAEIPAATPDAPIASTIASPTVPALDSAPTDVPPDPQATERPEPDLPTSEPDDSDTFAQWSTVEFALQGPESQGMQEDANPFAITVDITFTGPTGQTVVVPAFYDGDGAGSLDGNIWKVRFTPDTVGAWSFSSQSDNAMLTGQTASFTVVEPETCSPTTPEGLPNFACVGRLSYVGEHYLRFANGGYWLKGGADEPEDFLAPEETAGFETKEAAIDYLASKGINSIYLMLHNVEGDGENVWPWVGATQSEAKANHNHFDVAKLAEWEQLFQYIQARGIVLHLVLEDDSAWAGYNRELYYREMVARFGHHNGLYWNIAEEYQENHTPDQIKSYAQLLRDLDPYDQPITVHHADGLDRWEPFLGDPNIDLTSFQTTPTPQNRAAAAWFERVAAADQPIVIAFDETGQLDADQRDLTRHIVWSVYLGGGNYELFTRLEDGSFRDFAGHFEDMTRARTLIEQQPFWEMQPANTLLTSGDGYVFAKPGEVYIVYTPSGGSLDLDLREIDRALTASWFNPSDGTTENIGLVENGAIRTFTTPDNNDWVLLLDTPDVGGEQ